MLKQLINLLGRYIQIQEEASIREQERLREARSKIYMKLLEPYVRMFAGIKKPAEIDRATKQILSLDYRRTTMELKLLGSDDVVRGLNRFMQHAYSLEGDPAAKFTPKDMVDNLGGLLLVIRKDLGNEDTELEPVDMLRDWIKDIDTVLKQGSND